MGGSGREATPPAGCDARQACHARVGVRGSRQLPMPSCRRAAHGVCPPSRACARPGGRGCWGPSSPFSCRLRLPPPRDREFRPTRIRIQTTVFPRQRRWRATGLPQAQAVGLVVWDHRGRNPDDSRGGSPVTPQRQPAARRRSRYWRARIVAAIPKPARSVIQPGLISSSAATTSATLSHRRHARRR